MDQLVIDPPATTRVSPATRLPRRLPVAVLGLAGAGAVLVGCYLPWISTFAGLVGYPGVRGTNGRLLAAGAVVTLLVAGWYAARGGARLRTTLGALGFLLAAGCGYLLVELHNTLGLLAANPLAIASAGPGLYVCAVGAAIVFLTLFLPVADVTVPVPSSGVSSLHWATVLALAVAAAAHLPVIPEHLRAAPYLGVLFILFVLGAWTAAVLLLNTEDRRVSLAAMILCALAIGAYALTRTVALPQAADDVGNWLEPLGVIAVLSEAVVVVLGAIALRAPRAGSPARTGVGAPDRTAPAAEDVRRPAL